MDELTPAQREWLSTLWANIVEAVTQAMEWLNEIARRFWASVSAVTRSLEAHGAFPPAPVAHGSLWTSPFTGEVWRVCGRRGRLSTYHWTPLETIRGR